jgi:hypothetical protein
VTLKLYTVVRHDLSPGAQAAQSAHALAALALDHPDEFIDWDNGTIVLLQTDRRTSIESLVEAAEDGNIPHATFREPDDLDCVDPEDFWSSGWRDGVLTAIAFAPNWAVQHVLLKDLPLALSDTERKTKQLPRKRSLFG